MLSPRSLKLKGGGGGGAREWDGQRTAKKTAELSDGCRPIVWGVVSLQLVILTW
jgi:hypothetical protein